jgi:hypothetical protein
MIFNRWAKTGTFNTRSITRCTFRLRLCMRE